MRSVDQSLGDRVDDVRRRCLIVVDVGLLGVLFLAPLFMGGRGPIGKFVFVACVGVAVVGWCCRMCVDARAAWRLSGVEWLLLAGLVLLLLQLIPVGGSAMSVLSPSIAKYLPLWTADGLGVWPTISLDPDATRGALAVYLGYGLLFLVLVQRLNSVADVERILRWISWSVAGMAILGVAQLLFGNGKFGWIFSHPSRDTYGVAKGMFHNQNHFAHFLALGIGPIMWSLWGAEKQSFRGPLERIVGSKQSIAICLGLVVVAGLLTFSRGGVIAIGVAVVTCVGIYVWQGVLQRRSLLAIGAMGIVVVGALFIHGYEPLAQRLATLRDSGSLEEMSHGRAALWGALADGIREFPLLGTGVGSHRNVYPMFMEEFYDMEFTHGESGYIPLLLEAGVAGLIAMLIGIAFCIYWALVPIAAPLTSRSSAKRSIAICSGAVLPGIAASMIHSAGDFVWYITACMSLTVILAACACRLCQMNSACVAQSLGASESGGSQDLASNVHRISWRSRLAPLFADRAIAAPRLVWGVTAVVFTATSFFMIQDRWAPALAAKHWNDYKRISLAANDVPDQGEASELERLEVLETHLLRTLSYQPTDARANLRYAANCLRRFEIAQRHGINPMALSQIREAALASQFPSRQAQDAWLDVAIGENRQLLARALHHSRVAMRRSPLQGEGYIYLTNLSFLEGSRQEAKNEYIAQAQTVRPHSGLVLFAAGQEAALAGDTQQAIALWRRAFHQDHYLRALIVESFAPLVPAEHLLMSFEPDVHGLACIYHFYERASRTEDARIAASYYAPALAKTAASSEPNLASLYWQRAHDVYMFLGLAEQSLACAIRGVEVEPHSLPKRRTLALALQQCERFDDAVEQFEWCVSRRPDDDGLLQQLAVAKRASILNRSPVAAPSTRQRVENRY